VAEATRDTFIWVTEHTKTSDRLRGYAASKGAGDAFIPRSF